MNRLTVVAVIGIVLTFVPSFSGATTLGIMQSYNAFLLGNDTMSNVDSYGAIAVGGNANFSDYSVAGGLGSSGTNLVVGGSLTDYNGGTLNGSVVVGGNASLSSPTVNGNLAVNGDLSITGGGWVSGSVTYGGTNSVPNYYTATQGTTTLQVNFSDAASQMTTLTNGLSSLAQNGTVSAFSSNQPNTIVLTGASATQNVFDLTAAELSNANLDTLEINIPSGSTAIINVSGTNVSVGNFGTTINGGTDDDIIYNFYQATTVNVEGSFNGTMLAENATVNTTYGGFNGQLLADNMTGSIELHNDYFSGNLTLGSTSPTNTPEPSQSAAMLLGLMALGAIASRRTARRRGTRMTAV